MSTVRHPEPSPVDTRVMLLLHRCMRHELRLAPGAVRRTVAGDASTPVADHLDFLVAFVRHHHEIEDEFLWPVLRPRLDDDQRRIVELMESQHQSTSELLESIAASTTAWRSAPCATHRDRIAALLDELYPLLVEHLDAEEQRLLPIAARAMDADEWARLGDEGHRRSPKRYRSLSLGMFDHYGDPEVLATMTAAIPRPIRPVVVARARRTFRRRAEQVHGTPMPSRALVSRTPR
jgi:hemerythrin-like domain-containing protein